MDALDMMGDFIRGLGRIDPDVRWGLAKLIFLIFFALIIIYWYIYL